MRSAPLLPLLAAVVTTVLCSAAPPPGTERCLRGPFHGITVTDPTGAIVGHVDASDWGCLEGSLPMLVNSVPVPPTTSLCLSPAAPNPASPSTRLRFSLPRPVHVSLTVWSRSTGHGPPRVERVRTLMDADLMVGAYEVLWDGADDGGLPLPPDVYRVVLEVEGRAVCGDVEIR